MPSASIIREINIVRSPRVLQLEGIFDVPISERSKEAWEVSLPLDKKPWNIGLIVGPSGCGKTSIIQELFMDHIFNEFQWEKDKSIVDSFPSSMGIKDITKLLSSVGFSSPPAWLRPYRVLSNGEQFRVHIARALAESRDLCVIDEFTSVVDRVVAKVGSSAVAKTVRKMDKKFIASSCHYDIEDWLQPDWIYQPHRDEFAWRFVQQRPGINLEVCRVHYSTWNIFKNYHYLSRKVHVGARCFAAFWKNHIVGFAAIMPMPHPKMKNMKRGHRLVCLPDYQGVGIGGALADFCGALCKGLGFRFRIRTSHPAEKHRALKDPNWQVVSIPKVGSLAMGKVMTPKKDKKRRIRAVVTRHLVSAEYVGPGFEREEARQLWDASPVRA